MSGWLYALYNSEDEIIFSGGLLDLCRYLDRGRRSVESSISRIFSNKYVNKNIYINGEPYKLYRWKDK